MLNNAPQTDFTPKKSLPMQDGLHGVDQLEEDPGSAPVAGPSSAPMAPSSSQNPRKRSRVEAEATSGRICIPKIKPISKTY